MGRRVLAYAFSITKSNKAQRGVPAKPSLAKHVRILTTLETQGHCEVHSEFKPFQATTESLKINSKMGATSVVLK